ncbi:hypothetical protein [Flavobacterium sharifuzzamanii]|uniref:hypothetical protein n=1 Tax=Flavobacterium sharifuzzamanii TaxID=2211133 RepID=UPI000DAF382B|nr:hypothetical protein [Flavobacterium sharifuzzamanii]KAF2081964.1 hypothetical protein DMA14_05710 [Flavobacterium sharifuzzamanii]
MTKINKAASSKILLAIFGLTIFSFIISSFIRKTEKNEITKTYIHNSFPVFKSDASFFIVNDSVAVINYKNYALYEFEDIFNIQNDSAIINEKVINKYFLLKEKESYGYYYDSLNAKTGKRIRMDSILSKKAYYKQTFYFPSLMQFISSKKDQNGYKLIEKYKCKTKVDLTYPDTIIVYFSNKMKNTSFTLSKDLDSIKKMKVVKMRAIFNSQFIKGNPNKFPQYEYKFELKQDSISNLKKYQDFIEKKISR